MNRASTRFFYFCTMKHHSLTVLFSLILIFFGLQLGYGQYFSVGNDPSGIKWRQIKHQDFTLIYPDYYESRAKELYHTSSIILPSVSSSLYLKPYHFRAVVHPETIQSNGWAMWVPRKVELAPIPSLYNMAEKYSDHLLIHEYRHIVQLDKMDQGITRALGWFLGDQASASVQALHIPDWVSEGDAVLTESLLSNSGRGRNPIFSQGMRAIMLNDCSFKFDKARFGSYKDFVPNYYVFGYHLVSMARLLDPDRFWSDVMDNVARKPYRVANFNRFLHKRTGLWQGGLFQETKDYMCNFWKENSLQIGAEQLDLIFEDSTDYSNYLKPYAETDSSWICLRKSYSDLPAIVRIFRDRPDELIFYTGSINGASFSFSNGRISWAQQIADPRWEMRSFSDIFTLDIVTGKKERITKNQRFLYPVLNTVNTDIACIEERIDGSSHLLVLDDAGTVISTLEAPGSSTFRQPVWSAGGDLLYALLGGREGKKLIIWKIPDDSMDVLYDFGFKEVNQLELVDNMLFFTAPIGTIQGLYGLDLQDKTISKLIANDNGLGYPAVHKGELCISVYTPEGYRPAIVNMNQDDWISSGGVENLEEPLLSKIERADKEYPVDYGPVDTASIVSSEYNKLSHLFNFHSWAPAYLDTDSYSIRPGAMIMSQNDLNTLVSSFGVQHNKQTKGIDYFADLSYTGWYPKVGLGILAGRRHADTLLFENEVLTNVQYSDIETSVNIKLPLFYSKGAYYQRIQPYFYLTHHLTFNGFSLDAVPPGAINSLDLSYATATLGLAGQVIRRMSYRDLYPKWGFTAGIQAQAGITNPEVQASGRISTYLRLYSPGIIKNHSLRTYLGFSRVEGLGMPQLPFVSLPRGHYETVNQDYSSFKVDYSFPVGYPDWSIPSLLYITRFKANLFADGAHFSIREDPWSIKTGVDFTSNFYFLRIGMEFEAGVRIIYDPLEKDPLGKPWGFELLYSFDI